MATNPKPIDPTMIEGWLREIQCDPRLAIDQKANWRFDLAYPSNSPHQISVVNPKKPSRAVVVTSRAILDPQHIAVFGGLDEDAKKEFYLALQETLNRDAVEYFLEGVNPATLACPTGFRIAAVIFDDGLSLDALALRISSVYKAEIAGSLCVNRHLGPTTPGTSGQFEFKRLGTIQ
jgi:hypothetical protein